MSSDFTAEPSARSPELSVELAPSQPTALIQRPGPFPYSKVILPLLVAGAFLTIWDVTVRLSAAELFPTPGQVLSALGELLQKGLIFKYIIASLFRVTWGFTLAVLIGVPFGLLVGWFRWADQAFNPMIQALRPISPIAWIPIAIMWFKLTDLGPIFLIFLASVFPITVATAAAVKSVQAVHLRAAQNFGLHGLRLFRQVILPASLPQIITGLRVALGVAWLVLVAAEMFAVQSGLGYLIHDARNAGKRYDLVVAGMVLIGFIGWLLDLLMRQTERLQAVKWAYGTRND